MYDVRFVLYMMYYPPSLKYTLTASDALESPNPPVKSPARAKEWALSVVLAWVSVTHLFVSRSSNILHAALTPNSEWFHSLSPFMSWQLLLYQWNPTYLFQRVLHSGRCSWELAPAYCQPFSTPLSSFIPIA
jgi:hypothetical protein